MMLEVLKLAGAQTKIYFMSKQKQTRIADIKDGFQFYLSKRKKTLYRLDKIDKGTAIITSLDSWRTYYKPKKTVCYPEELISGGEE